MIAFNLKNLYNKYNVSQREVAEKLNLREATLSAMANNKIKEIPLNVLDGLLCFFNCSADELITYTSDDEVNINEKRKEISCKFDVEFSTNEERKTYVANGISISTLDGIEPSDFTKFLLNEYVAGTKELDEIKEEVIRNYQE